MLRPSGDGAQEPVSSRIRLPGRGVELAMYDWGGPGPVALCAHATGFCGRLWQLVAEELAGEARVVAFDARGHGQSTAPEGADAYRWRELAADVAALVDALSGRLGVERVDVGVGNSMGGTTMLVAAASCPQRFGALALVDPVILPRSRYREPHAGPQRIVEQARRRRAVFPSRAAVVDAYRRRDLFSDWQPRALDLYAAHGFRDLADGRVELRCAPDVEAAVFLHSADVDPFPLVRSLPVPGEVMHAERSFAVEPLRELCAEAPALRLVPLGCGHLAPMIDPALVAGRIRAVLAVS